MPTSTRNRLKILIGYLLFSFLIFLIDRASKNLLIHFIKPGKSLILIKNIFHLTLTYNTGTAFGLFKDWNRVFIIIKIVAIPIILGGLIKTNYTLTRLALSLILAGAVGNLFDRIRFGYVIDFLDFRIWPIFNISDMAITIGVGILFFKVLFLNEKIPVKNK